MGILVLTSAGVIMWFNSSMVPEIINSSSTFLKS